MSVNTWKNTCAHSLRLENFDWHATERMASHFVSLTTDMGTEMLLNSVEGVIVGTAFGYWCNLGIEEEIDGDVAEHPAPEGSCTIGFSKSMYVPGSVPSPAFRFKTLSGMFQIPGSRPEHSATRS